MPAGPLDGPQEGIDAGSARADVQTRDLLGFWMRGVGGGVEEGFEPEDVVVSVWDLDRLLVRWAGERKE